MTTFPYVILDWYWLFISSTHHIHISTNKTKWSKTAKISGNSPAIAGYKWQDFFVSLSFFSPQTDSGVKRVSRKWPEGGWARHPPLHSVSTGDNQLYGLCNPFHTSRRPLVSASPCLTQSNGRHTVFSVGVKKRCSGECRRENAQFMSHDSSKGQKQLRARVRVRVCLHATLVMPSPVLQHSRPAKRVVEHGHC